MRLAGQETGDETMNAVANYPTMIEALNAAAAYFAAEPAAAELEYTILLADGSLTTRFIGPDGYAFAESRYDDFGRRKTHQLRSM